MGFHTLAVGDASGVMAARQDGRLAARELGARLAGATLAATVVSELARNVIQHAGGGEIGVGISEGFLIIDTRDHGPGIADPEQALSPGYSTDGSDGRGLCGIARIAESLSIVNGIRDGVWVRAVLSARSLGAARQGMASLASAPWAPAVDIAGGKVFARSELYADPGEPAVLRFPREKAVPNEVLSPAWRAALGIGEGRRAMVMLHEHRALEG